MITRLLLAGTLLPCGFQYLNAQVAALPEIGANPYKSYDGGAVDHVELQNGNLYARIPLVSYPQLGALNLSFSLLVNGSSWGLNEYCDNVGDCEISYLPIAPPGNCATTAASIASVELQMDQELIPCSGVTGYLNQQPNGTTISTEYDSAYTYGVIDASGAAHIMGFDQSDPQTLHDLDGAGYTMHISGDGLYPAIGFNPELSQIMEPNGIAHQAVLAVDASGNVIGKTTTISDANGNTIRHVRESAPGWLDQYVDSVGRIISNSFDVASTSDCPNLNWQEEPISSASQWRVPGPNGTTNTYLFCYSAISVATNFIGSGPGVITNTCIYVGEPDLDCVVLTEQDSSYQDVQVLQSVVLPNRTYWAFRYDTVTADHPESYGDLTEIVLPSGGTIKYQSTTIRSCGPGARGDDYLPLKRAVIRRNEDPLEGPSIVTNYTYNPTSTIVTDADSGGNDTVHEFTLDHPGDELCGAAETATKWYQGLASAGNLLKETDTTYVHSILPTIFAAMGGPSFNSPSFVNRRPSTITTTSNGVVVEAKTYGYDPWFVDTQPWSAGGQGGGTTYCVDQTEINGDCHKSFAQSSSIAFAKPTAVDDGVKTSSTQRYSVLHPEYASANFLELPGVVNLTDDASSVVTMTTGFVYDKQGSEGVRGNVTKLSRSGPSTPAVVTTTDYSPQGMPTDTFDANLNAGLSNGNHVHIAYDSTGVFPSSVQQSSTSGIPHIEYFNYDSVTGYPVWHTDQNGSGPNDPNHTTRYAYDSMGRLTSVSDPPTSVGQGGTTYCYVDFGQSSPCSGVASNTVYMTVAAAPDPNINAAYTHDGLGRVIHTTMANGAVTDTTYDGVGNVHSVSNPHFTGSSPTDGITQFTYDGLGRKTVQTQPDGSSQSWAYSGNVTTFTDEVGNSRRYTSDTLGRLTSVAEDPNGLNLQTVYAYDVLDNLTGVNQIGNGTTEAPRQRSFTYDSLSRLVQAYNPESGWTCYGTTSGGSAPNGSNCTSGYDANGNLGAKTDALGIRITYAYDPLNRLTGKNYSDATPPVAYNYDEQAFSWFPGYQPLNTIGRLSSASTGGSNLYSLYGYSYDAMGRPTVKAFMHPNGDGNGLRPGVGTGGNTYDLAGNVTFTAQAAGLYLDQTRNGAGQVTDVSSDAAATWPTGGVASFTVLANATYSPFGTPSTRLLGDGLTETKTYDNRGRMTSIVQSKPGSAVAYSAFVVYAPNGNVIGSSDSVNGDWIYSYDSLNRLKGATSAAGQILGWTYDSFGNRKTQTASGSGSAPQSVLPFTGNTNRIDSSAGISYDAAGHVTVDNLGQSYSYDAEGRITSASFGATVLATYKYDSEGNLLYENGGHGVQIFQRNAAGQPVWNYAPAGYSGAYISSGIYIDGDWIGSWQNGTLAFVGKDWLGTKRYESLGEGSSISTAVPIFVDSYTSLPFGDNLSSIGMDSTYFTGKERDAESGLDYFGARYYSSSMGRFSSPDPQGNSYADFSNPQSWNMYAYVMNNPLKYTDPTGMYCDYSDHNDPSSGFDSSQFDYNSNSGECGTNGGQWVNDAYTHGGFDDAGRPQEAISANVNTSTTPQPTANEALNDLTTTIPGLEYDVLGRLLPRSIGGNQNSFYTPDPFILFGTHSCGPGGGNTSAGGLDPACQVHDKCYGAAPGGGISAGNNVNPLTPMTAGQAGQAQQCNQALYDAARNHPDAPGSKAVQWWMVNGSHLPGGAYILFPGTEAKPW